MIVATDIPLDVEHMPYGVPDHGRIYEIRPMYEHAGIAAIDVILETAVGMVSVRGDYLVILADMHDKPFSASVLQTRLMQLARLRGPFYERHERAAEWTAIEL